MGNTIIVHDSINAETQIQTVNSLSTGSDAQEAADKYPDRRQSTFQRHFRFFAQTCVPLSANSGPEIWKTCGDRKFHLQQ